MVDEKLGLMRVVPDEGLQLSQCRVVRFYDVQLCRSTIRVHAHRVQRFVYFIRVFLVEIVMEAIKVSDSKL